MNFDTLKEQIAYYYGKADGVDTLIDPWLKEKASIDDILRVARQKSIRFHDIAKKYEKDLAKEEVKNFAEMTAGQLMKKLIEYSQSGAPVPFMQYMMEQWMETVNEVEDSKNSINAVESIDITPRRGVDIGPLADRAQELANKLDRQVFFEHRETKCVAIPGGSSTTLIKNYTKIRKDPDSIFGPYAKSKSE